jgi:putative hemolysin
MQALTKGRYHLRIAQTAAELRAAQRLRAVAFHPDHPAQSELLDHDRFDALCQHILIEDLHDDALVGCFRIMDLPDGRTIGSSYAAQFYDLSALSTFAAPMIEIGRFCLHPARHDPDILRLAWAGLTRHVDAQGVQLMFGCSSFRGTDPARYQDAFAMLRDGHLAPPAWRPGIKAAQVVRFGTGPEHRPDRRRGLQTMPPLLRSYLMMGGWVSDHAVIDTQMDTLHVFTGLEISAIPDARKTLLRAVSA